MAQRAAILFLACLSAAAQPPTAGRSLFDTLVGPPGGPPGVPYPFERLLQRVNLRNRRILVPLGRSLQRSAAAPLFFKYPRAIVAFAGDRLFLGYQEKAQVIEVLSYNETAGRFEFQLVSGYRAGAAPRIEYAKRAVCVVCHQNQAPLFPRPLWDETNSNARIAHLLAAQKREFYGFPIEQSADVPYEIDLAVHRANEFSVYQLVWSRADRRTRSLWLLAMLRCRVAGNCETNPTLHAALLHQWRANWPHGLPVPNPEIPNRNPLAILSRGGPTSDAGMIAFLTNQQKNIAPVFEPGVPRPPLEIWQADPERVERVVRGLGTFFTDADVQAIRRAGGWTKIQAAVATLALAEDVFRPAPLRRALIDEILKSAG